MYMFKVQRCWKLIPPKLSCNSESQSWVGVNFSLGEYISEIKKFDSRLQEIGASIQRHLISRQHTAFECQVQGLRLFKIRPKHHSCDHLAPQIRQTKLNPRKIVKSQGSNNQER